MIVQIYEIQTPDEALAMIRLGVDHIGSVLSSLHQWRNPILKATVQIVQAAGCKNSLIPLFTEIDIIMAAIDYYRPDIIHFCDILPPLTKDSEGVAQCLNRQAYVKKHFPDLTIMRSIPIGTAGASSAVPSLQWAQLFEPLSNCFLTDTLLTVEDTCIEPCSDAEQPVAGFVGITGKECDWDVARQLVRQSGIPVILAGGIGPANVAQGIKKVRPAGVDSCTLTNAVDTQGRTIRFKKDMEKVSALVYAARNTEKELAATMGPSRHIPINTMHQ